MRHHPPWYMLVLFVLGLLFLAAPADTTNAAEGGSIVVFAPDRVDREAFREDLQSHWGRRAELRAFVAPRDPEAVTSTLEALAQEPGLKAVVVGEAPLGSVAGIERLRAARPEVHVFAVEPDENLERVGRAASLTLALNQPARGFLYPTLATRMGAENLVYLSFPRHQEMLSLSRQYRVLSAVSRDLGLNLITDFNGPDPRNIDEARVEEYLRQKVTLFLNSYGQRIAFMTTSGDYSRLLAPMIAERGGALLEPNLPNLMLGLPEAMGLGEGSQAYTGSWRRLLALVDEKYLETRPLGQFASWTYPYPHTALLAAVELAATALDGQTGLDQPADLYELESITAALAKFSPGAKWQLTAHIDHSDGSLLPQVVLLLEDTYWFGRGFQGFPRLNIPSVYYRIY